MVRTELTKLKNKGLLFTAPLLTAAALCVAPVTLLLPAPPPVPSVPDTSPRPRLQRLPHSCGLGLQTSSGLPSPVMALASPTPLARLPRVLLATDGHPHLHPQPATPSSSGCISVPGLLLGGPATLCGPPVLIFGALPSLVAHPASQYLPLSPLLELALLSTPEVSRSLPRTRTWHARRTEEETGTSERGPTWVPASHPGPSDC